MKRTLFSLLALIAVLYPVSVTGTESKQVVGLVERVRIHPTEMILNAKLDTGADNSSIHATDIVRFKRRGDSWVRFSVTNAQKETETIERRLVRVARIKRTEGQRQKRPVVMLGICLGNVYREVQVTLVDRSRFRCRMILGRSFLRNAFLVDPSRKRTVEPNCGDAPKD